jgi:NAD(P)-dependent dehydrogenase (short-subunit alcohol dehydrogenase family)
MTKVPGVDYVVCDVTSDQAVDAAVRRVIAKAGHIDLLVNNAGVGLVGAAEESSLEQARSIFDVNLFGVIRMTNAVLPVMRQRLVRTHRQHQAR